MDARVSRASDPRRRLSARTCFARSRSTVSSSSQTDPQATGRAFLGLRERTGLPVPQHHETCQGWCLLGVTPRRPSYLLPSPSPWIQLSLDGCPSAADVPVRSRSHNEPPLTVSDNRNGLALQDAECGGCSQEDEAPPVRHDGVGAQRAGPFARLDAPPETFRCTGEERHAGACGDVGSERAALEVTQLRHPVRIVRPA